MVNSKKLIAFDVDGTLTESKSPITSEMSDLLLRLLEKYYVAIIGGGSFVQFQKQVLLNFPNTPENILAKLLLFPTCGGAFYTFKDGEWTSVYEGKMTEAEKNKIKEAWEQAVSQSGVVLPTPSFGRVMEDRGAQMTFSALGQEAPLSEKEKWDPDRTKRIALRKIMVPLLPEFEVGLGGITSIDINKKGADKAYAIHKAMDYVGATKNEVTFVGDKLELGGNDHAAIKTGVDCVGVLGPNETAEFIKTLI